MHRSCVAAGLQRFFFVFSLVLLITTECSGQTVSPLTKELNEAADALDTPNGQELREAEQVALLKLLSIASKSACAGDTPQKLRCKLDQISKFSNNLSAVQTSTAAQQADLWKSLGKFVERFPRSDVDLVAVIKLATDAIPATPQAAAEPAKTMAQLDTLITGRVIPYLVLAEPGATIPRVEIDQMVNNIWSSGRSLDKLLRKLPQIRRINVLGAWFGDLSAIRAASPSSPEAKGVRFCSATRAVRMTCQGKTECGFGATAQGTASTAPTGSGAQQTNATNTGTNNAVTGMSGNSLCGYDPTPFAAPRSKGLIVRYECLSVDIEAWRLLGTDAPLAAPYNPETRSAELRTTAVGEIRCQGAF